MNSTRGGLSTAPVALGDADNTSPRTSGPTRLGSVLEGLDLKVRPDSIRPDDAPRPQRSYDATLRGILEEAGVPRRYLDRSLQNFAIRPGATVGLKAARQAAEENGGLFLIGPPGCGKTHLSVGILRCRAERLLEDHPAEFNPLDRYGPDGTLNSDLGELVPRPPLGSRFVCVPELLDELRARITAPERPDPLPALIAAPLLVLDDLGREKVSEWVTDRLYLLIGARYNAMKPTIVTSNFSLDELARRGYAAMVSRLIEDAPAVRLSASDFRKEAQRHG